MTWSCVDRVFAGMGNNEAKIDSEVLQLVEQRNGAIHFCIMTGYVNINPLSIDGGEDNT